ncbi:uncharacterized protein LOC134229158 [Saccostrea cucullata]|uniref:uncharacterized protein LOC134229158 n=1 Tax=Saccostrea cuccullata TaxID=36930 RepID=UPI002ED45A60
MGRKGQELGTEAKNIIRPIDLIQSGLSRHKVSEMLKIPKSTVIDVARKFFATGSVENKPRSGRPAKMKEMDYRGLERLVKTHRRESLSDITLKFNEGRTESETVSKRTIQRHLKNHEYRRCVSKKKLVVKEVNRRKRLAWCREKRRWTVQSNWNKVIFSDEINIMTGHDQRVHIWRKRNEGWRPDLVQPRPSQPRYEVMIWGCIS